MKKIVKSKYEEGVYVVDGDAWNVGDRYQLEKVLGGGSFSQVCLAKDKETGGYVALKRIANVLSNFDNAKRVLRELCILRRLDHPNIIHLHDAFTKPSSAGPMRYING